MFFASKIRANIGVNVTQIARIGNPMIKHQDKCSLFNQSMSVKIRTLLTSSSISTH